LDAGEVIYLVTEYGYAALFFLLWLGIVGLPVPDEMIVMTGGLVSSLQILKPMPSFLITYLGVVFGLSLGYIIGRIWGNAVYCQFAKKKKWSKYLIKSEELIHRYGSYALCISYFLPGVRHILPYLMGSYRVHFLKYFIFSYSTALFWTGLYYLIGYKFGKSIHVVTHISQQLGYIALAFIAFLALVIYTVQTKRKKAVGKSR
jgi:membrane protein DedA with SNARE-associated domain